jgi:hypothetical protein
VHIVAEVSPAHIPGELAKPGMAPRFQAWTLTPPYWDLLVYNLRAGAQAGPRMRTALDRSIPRAALMDLYRAPSGASPGPIDVIDPQPIDLEALGREALSATWGMAGLPDRPALDDAAARAEAAVVLDELGWTMQRGLRQRETGSLRLSLMFNAGGGRPKEIASVLKNAWRELGIVVPYATASWSYVFGLMQRGEFDIALLRLSTSSDADLYDLFHSRGEENISGVTDGALDEALEAYRAATDREGRDRRHLPAQTPAARSAGSTRSARRRRRPSPARGCPRARSPRPSRRVAVPAAARRPAPLAPRRSAADGARRNDRHRAARPRPRHLAGRGG